MAARRKSTARGPRTVKAKDRFRLRLGTGEEYELVAHAGLRRLAMKWSYLVGNRARWRKDGSSPRDMAREAIRDLRSIPLHGRRDGRGLSRGDLGKIARGTLLEVAAPGAAADAGWALRVFPWETVLSTMSNEFTGRSPLITRSLDATNTRKMRAPETALFVQSEPGALEGHYVFDGERDLVHDSLLYEAEGVEKPAFTVVATPNLRKLEEAIGKRTPDIIHLAGLDAHEGARLLELPFDGRRRDGYYVRGASGEAKVVEPEALATTLTAAGRDAAARLLCCGFYNSGRRICASAVTEGIGAAIGFADEIDDTKAEVFYASFYRALKHSDYALLPAFYLALRNTIETAGGLQGAGITLWSRHSLLKAMGRDASTWRQTFEDAHAAAKTKILAQRRREQTGRSGSGDGADDEEEVGGSAAPSGTGTGGSAPRGPGSSTGSGFTDRLLVQAKPLRDLNYARLHNGHPLFTSFTLTRLGLAPVHDVHVEVVLYIGAQGFRYRGSFDVEGPALDIIDQIRVPLTWAYVRDLRESVRTTIYTCVTHAGRTIRETTWEVNLLPVNEWLDTPTDSVYLPSFVRPSDPAIARIIDSAQKYLRAYAGPGSGFDGYQSVSGSRGKEDLTGIDHQVEAIWHALVEDYRLDYVNPPPTYTPLSQRLRSPSRVIDEGRGTCIDLALLVAACLEYVEIHPVLFLMKGHAFVGFWRSEQAAESFHDMLESMESAMPAKGADLTEDDVPAGAGLQRDRPWAVRPPLYEEVLARIWDETLVPIESVYLTDRQPLWAAWDAGTENLEAREEFDVMLQVHRARGRDDDKFVLSGVTPIPFEGAV